MFLTEWGSTWSGMPIHVQLMLSVLIGGLSGVSALLKSDEATWKDCLPQFVSSSLWGFIGFSLTPVIGVEPVISKIGVAAIAGWLGSDSLNIILNFLSRFGGPPGPSGPRGVVDKIPDGYGKRRLSSSRRSRKRPYSNNDDDDFDDEYHRAAIALYQRCAYTW